MAVHVLTKKVVGKLYIKIHILYVQQYDRHTISISAVSNANWISLKFTRNIRLGYSSFTVEMSLVAVVICVTLQPLG